MGDETSRTYVASGVMKGTQYFAAPAVAWSICLVMCIIAMPITGAEDQGAVDIVHELGEAWEMFKGEDKMLEQLHHGLSRDKHREKMKDASQARLALERAAEAAGAATIESSEAAVNDSTNQHDRSDKANEKAVQALQSASDEISQARHSSTKIDAGAAVKQRADAIVQKAMDGLKELKHQVSSQPAAAKGSASDAPAAPHSSATTVETIDTMDSARATVNAMVTAAREETRKAEHEAASDIQRVEKAAAKQLQSDVKRASVNLDDRIQMQVRQVQAHIENKVEQQITDQIAANQVEGLFEKSEHLEVVQANTGDSQADAQASSTSNADGTKAATQVDADDAEASSKANADDKDAPVHVAPEQATPKKVAAKKVAAKKVAAKKTAPEQAAAKKVAPKKAAAKKTAPKKAEAQATTDASAVGHDMMSLSFGPQ